MSMCPPAPGGTEERVGVEGCGAVSGMVWFEVEDSGCGVAAGREVDIFEEFVQEDSSTTRK